MSEPTLRRNPARIGRPPRHADSPVSYAVPPSGGNLSEDGSDEDDSEAGDAELLQDLDTGFEVAAQQQSINSYVVMHDGQFLCDDHHRLLPISFFLDVLDNRNTPSPMRETTLELESDPEGAFAKWQP